MGPVERKSLENRAGRVWELGGEVVWSGEGPEAESSGVNQHKQLTANNMHPLLILVIFVGFFFVVPYSSCSAFASLVFQ